MNEALPYWVEAWKRRLAMTKHSLKTSGLTGPPAPVCDAMHWL